MAKDSEGEYARILRRIVDDPDYWRLHPSARFVWLTLLIAREFRVIGIAALDMGALQRRTGLSQKVCADAIELLGDADVLRLDGPWCWIRNHLRFQENSEAWAKSRMTMIGLSKRVNELPVGLSFFREFIELYAGLGFNFDLQPRHSRYLVTLPNNPIKKANDNPEPETPETPETPDTPETPESTQEPLAVVAAAPTSSVHVVPPRPDSFHVIAGRHVGCFNAVFSRRLRVSPEILDKTRALIRSNYRPWQIVALPIMVEAQGLNSDMRKRLTPQIILRDGKHGRTVGGQTFGATHWLERALSRLDQTTLDERLAGIARDFDVLKQLLQCNVIVPGAA